MASHLPVRCNTEYEIALARFVKEKGIQPCHPRWQFVIESVMPLNLMWARCYAGNFLEEVMPYEFELRPKKTLKRVAEKLERAEKENPVQPGLRIDDLPCTNDRFFKAQCDFAAIRVHCPVDKISEYAEEIAKVFEADSVYGPGKVYIVDREGKGPPDIIKYMYAWHGRTGHIVEIQIGSAFAMHTFKVDSFIRDGGEATDLWDNGFYENVKQCLLEGKKVTDLKALGFQGDVNTELVEALRKDDLLLEHDKI